ncbi:OmpW/AlkL family protein [Halomonas sp. WWR20]
MTKTQLFSAAVLAGACVFATQTAMAYGQGDIFVRAGVAKSSADDAEIRNQDLDLNDETGFVGGVGYMFHDKLGLELSSSEKFEHEFSGGSFEQRPINLMVQYYPLGGMDARIQPYVGAGVNYTRFSDESLDGGSLNMDHSWGAVGQLGVDLTIMENVALNGFATYTDVDSDVNANYGGNSASGKAELDPVTIGGGITFRF